MNPETKIEMRACELVFEHLGIVGAKLTTPGRRGYPDRIFWVPGGSPVLVEFKVPGGELRAEQATRIAELKSLWYTVHVMDDAVQTLRLLIEYAEAAVRDLLSKSRISVAQGANMFATINRARGWCDDR